MRAPYNLSLFLPLAFFSMFFAFPAVANQPSNTELLPVV